MLNWRDPKNPLSGGAERVSRAFLAALVPRGHQVHWFANGFNGCDPQDTVDGIKIVRGGGKGTSIVRAVQWYRLQEPFDLVIDQHHGIPWYAPLWCRTNCVAYIHEVLGPIWSAFYSWPLSALGRWQERWTHWLYRKVPFWTPSNSTKKALLENGAREVMVIPNGTDTTPLAQIETKVLRQPLQLVAVSRLAPNKRVEHAITAIKILLARGVEAHLTVVGTGEMESELRKIASTDNLRGHVSFTGQLAEGGKNEKLRCAHFLIHTSIREGWGLNVIEANAMGTPAVVYPVAGLVDSTLHDETGIVAAAESPESVANALGDLLTTPEKYDRLRVNAWQRSKAFQWKEVLPQACSWLEGQASKGRRGSRQASPKVAQ